MKATKVLTMLAMLAIAAGAQAGHNYYDDDDDERGWTPQTHAPEIDPASAISGMSLLLGGLAVVRGRRKQS